MPGHQGQSSCAKIGVSDPAVLSHILAFPAQGLMHHRAVDVGNPVKEVDVLYKCGTEAKGDS